MIGVLSFYVDLLWWVLISFAQVVGYLWLVFPDPGMWACICICFLPVPSCGFFFRYCLLVVPSMWEFGIGFIRWFLSGLMPLFLCFRGGAARFSFFLGPFWLRCILFVGVCPW